MFIKRRFKTQP